MLKGQQIKLVAIERGDLPQLMAWRNNPDFRKYFREFQELNTALQERWYEDKVLNDPAVLMFSVRRLSDDELLGCCGLVYINWIHRHADLSLYIGWKDAYIDDEGYAEDAAKTLIRYGFGELGLNKIWTEIYSFDAPKKALYDRIGFKQDGLLRKNYFYDGKWWDSRIISILREEFPG